MVSVANDSAKLYFKWSNHTTNFLETIQTFYKEESLANVTLSCGEGKCLKAHKLILSACSDYFSSILKEYQDWDHPIIYLDNVNFKDLQYVVTFMYHGELHLPQDHLVQILALGQSLQIKGLGSSKAAEEDGEAQKKEELGSAQKKEERVPDIDGNVQQPKDSDDLNETAKAGPKLSIIRKKTPKRLSRTSMTAEKKQQRKSKKISSSRSISASSDRTIIINPLMGESGLQSTSSQKTTKKRPRTFSMGRTKLEKRCRKQTKRSTLSQETASNGNTPQDPPLVEESNGNNRPKTPLEENPILDETSRPFTATDNIASNETPITSCSRPTSPFKTSLSPHNEISIKTSPLHESSAMDALLNSFPGPNSPDSEYFSCKRSPVDCHGDCFGFTDTNSPEDDGIFQVVNGTVLSPAPNAFMLFTKDFRTKLTQENPTETNQQISKRLSTMWKNIIPEDKKKYYDKEKKLEEKREKLKQAQLDQQQPEIIVHQPIKIEDENWLEANNESERSNNYFLIDHTYTYVREKSKEKIIDTIDITDD